MLQTMRLDMCNEALKGCKANDNRFDLAVDNYVKGVDREKSIRTIEALIRDGVPNVVGNIVYLWRSRDKYKKLEGVIKKVQKLDCLSDEDKVFITVAMNDFDVKDTIGKMRKMREFIEPVALRGNSYAIAIMAYLGYFTSSGEEAKLYWMKRADEIHDPIGAYMLSRYYLEEGHQQGNEEYIKLGREWAKKADVKDGYVDVITLIMASSDEESNIQNGTTSFLEMLDKREHTCDVLNVLSASFGNKYSSVYNPERALGYYKEWLSREKSEAESADMDEDRYYARMTIDSLERSIAELEAVLAK